MTTMMSRLAGLLMLSLVPALACALEAEVHTNKGIFIIELDPEHAPETVRNFVRYVKEDFYAGTIFHRVIPGFIIQGGGYDMRVRRKATHEPVRSEANNGLSNVRGSVAMARRGNIPDSATSQFYINLVDNPHLDGGASLNGYTVFGRVIQGMDVVDKIAASPTRARGQFMNLPVERVFIESVTLHD